MRADLTRFLQHVDVFLGELLVRMFRVVLVDQLRQPQGACQSRRTATDNDHVRLHLRTLDPFHLLAKNDHECLERSIELAILNEMISGYLGNEHWMLNLPRRPCISRYSSTDSPSRFGPPEGRHAQNAVHECVVPCAVGLLPRHAAVPPGSGYAVGVGHPLDGS